MSDKVTDLTADTVFAALASEPAVTPEEYKAILADAITYSDHNVELAEAAFAGSDFRVAFRKPGKKEWTRVAGVDQTTLQSMLIKEIESRQYSLRDYMVNLTRSFILGVFGT